MTAEKKREAWQTGAMIGCGMVMVVMVLLAVVFLVGGVFLVRASPEVVEEGLALLT